MLVLVIAALWMLSRAVDGVTDLVNPGPAPVAGSPFDTIAPQRPPSSGSPTLDRIALRGRLIVAIRDTPRLAQRSPGSGSYTGFDIALLTLIARDLGVDPARTSFKPLAPGNREAALRRGEADLILGGYEITPERSAEPGIAGPYLVRSVQLVVPATSRVHGLGSLGRGKVCAPAGSTAAATLTVRGVPLQTRSTLPACADLLSGTRVAAIAGDQDAVTAIVAQRPEMLRVIGQPLGTTDYGIGLPPDDPVLHQRITAVLRRAIADGTWAQLYVEYLGTPAPSPPAPR
jgi:ABC-type amino acid transport substrate-binding protein